MPHRNRWYAGIVAVLATGVFNTAYAANSEVKITEWMYQPANSAGLGEFIEFTNLSANAINFSGWSFDDNHEVPGTISLSSFGTVNAGESVILTDDSAAHFRSTWNLAASVKVIGGNNENLGRSDEINLYDATNTLIDRLTYNDQGSGNVKGPRTNGVSAHIGNVNLLGGNNASQWTLSAIGDNNGSYQALSGEIGSPGKITSIAAVPLASTETMMLSALGLLGTLARRRNRKV